MKSPLNSKPLRNPGQSAREHVSVQVDSLMVWVVFACVLFSIAAVEWLHYFWPQHISPWVLTSMALAAIAGVIVKIRLELPILERYKLGQAGEKAVGQHLESMRRTGAIVLHDVPGDDFNVDHVILCRQGIFVIETKTWSKPDKGRPQSLSMDTHCRRMATQYRIIPSCKLALLQSISR